MDQSNARDRELLDDLLDSAHAIEVATADVDFDAFVAERILRSGILHELMIVGEAANQLSPSLRARYPEVPWRRMIDFRNVIVHGYAGLTWERVWDTVTINVPELRAQIAAVLAAEFPGES